MALESTWATDPLNLRQPHSAPLRVDGSKKAWTLAHERRRDPMSAPDLEDAVVRLDAQPLDDRSQSCAQRFIAAATWEG